MKFEGDIFIQNNNTINLSSAQKWYWSGITFCLVFCFLLIQNQDYWKNETLDLILKTACFISLGVFTLGKFGAIGSSEKVNGKLEGKIIITKESIIIDSKNYLIKDTNRLKLSINDYRDKYRHPGPNYIGSWFKSGTNNEIEFEYLNKSIKTKFRIDLEDEFETLQELKKEFKNTIANTVHN
jgi:hypothetical protein